MSKLSHSNEEAMLQIETNNRVRRGEELPITDRLIALDEIGYKPNTGAIGKDAADHIADLARQLAESKAENERLTAMLSENQHMHSVESASMAALLERAENERDEYAAAITAMAEDGWLYHGVEGMDDVQKKCYAAYIKIIPPKDAARKETK